MKLAIPTEDKTTISEHFGGAPYFTVVTVEDNKITNKEIREKPGHKDFAGEEHSPQTSETGRHGIGPVASERHKKIFEVIKDCDLIITGRMGLGAYIDMQGFGMKVIVCDVKDIDGAVSLYLEGKLSHKEDRIC
ncbi:NifB/NifX family molybdenum-iron cluster-binding protein [Desulfothermus naphthae]